MTPEQRAAICDYHGVDGWQKGQMCKGSWIATYAFKRETDWECRACGYLGAMICHEIPPPDLDSPAGLGLLLEALRKTEIVTSIDFGQQHILLWRYNSRKARTELNTKTQIIDDNLPAALQQAAWDAMPEEAKHAS